MQGGAGPSGPVRPAIHYSPAATWLNDPNGLIFHNSLWHLYYQTNPRGLTWGNMSWGHATSPDLAHWTEHETAISLDESEEIFSGSMVCDETGSAGFGAGALVAIYTSHRGTPDVGVHQTQALAWSTDGGFTFHKFAGNPVLDRDSADFRAPKVFRHGDRWLMVAVEAVENVVVLYASDYLGDFDGVTFTPSADPGAQGWLDQGRDYYAAVSFFDAPDDRRVMIGWMNNWEYANALPSQPWAMQMAWPRELSIAGSVSRGIRRLIQTPAPLPTGPETFSFDGSLAGDLTIPAVAATAPALVEVEIERGGASLESACPRGLPASTARSRRHSQATHTGSRSSSTTARLRCSSTADTPSSRSCARPRCWPPRGPCA